MVRMVLHEKRKNRVVYPVMYKIRVDSTVVHLEGYVEGTNHVILSRSTPQVTVS